MTRHPRARAVADRPRNSESSGGSARSAAAPAPRVPGASVSARAAVGATVGRRILGIEALVGFWRRRAGRWTVAALVVAAVVPVPPVPPVALQVVGTLLFAIGGAGAGVVARVVLARMRRGARVRAPVCEAAVALSWAVTGAAWLAGAVPGRWLPALLGLSWLAVAGSVVDLRHRRLPDALTVPALPVALLLVLPLGPAALGRAAAGAAVALAVHAGVHVLAPRALGGGDVKLAGSLGAVLAASSWSALALGAGLAAVLSGVVAVALLAGGRTGRAGSVPHGPSMLLATWLVVAGAALGAGAG